jgi:Mrp family chromosome partitioning ATPase
MSRIFELLQRIEQETQLRNRASLAESSDQAPEASAWPDDLPWPIVACERPSSKLPEAVRAEISKLINRLFGTSGPAIAPLASPQTLVFSGFEQGNGPGRVTAITSDMLAGEATDIRVCAVDADFRNPSLHNYFRISNSTGLADALQHPAASRQFTCRVTNNLWIMSCGMPAKRDNGHSQIGSKSAQAVMADLRRSFDYVLMTAGNVTGSEDTLVLVQAARGVILVIEANSTRREVAEKYKEFLEAANVRVLGAVLHNRTFPIPQSLYARL